MSNSSELDKRNECSDLVAFGNCRLDTRNRLLWCDEENVRLPPKAIDLLCLLITRQGDVVTKQEIFDHVWNGSFVEETNLTHNIYLLRKTLSDLGQSDVIKTVPRRGYRFAGEVREPVDAETVIEKYSSTKTVIEIEDEPSIDPKADRSLSVGSGAGLRSPRAIFLIAATALILSAGVFLFSAFNNAETGSESTAIRSIAVLPVRSFSGNNDDEELRLRITDALITRLGNQNEMIVRPTHAVLSFGSGDVDVVEAGRSLKVDAVLDGRIQQEGDRLRVTLQLIRVSSGEHLWSEQFDGHADQILNLQDIIAGKVVSSLRSEGIAQQELASRPTENSEAYEAYLRGRYFWNKRDAPSLYRAIDYFTEAAKLDPNFSEAYSGLADTQHLIFNYNIDVSPEVIAKAKDNLQRALELKPGSPDALITLGTIQMGSDWNWKGAEESLKLAVANAPNSSIAHMRYGALLIRTRRFDEAVKAFERSLDLDPLSITANMNLGMAHFCSKDFEQAELQFRKTLELDENVGGTRWLLSRTLWQSGRKDEAVREIVLSLELDGNRPLAEVVREKAANGDAHEAIRSLLHEWRDNPSGTNPHNMAYLSTYLGDKERAVYWLERSLGERHPWTTWAAAAPEFETLRDEPRYRELLSKIGLAI